ncbi:cupin [Bifidobacterium aemilianum]|uniref:Cupin n=1 Tax=Bifidobacterium aemilianum TaxID=2493120 RepID=A0A366K8N6_9BIFI|nr:cupin domain-containing protein [Bifidobacterium aemilianum]RBP97528.1 cupin [Bifidobacterium aemilianum]
MSLALESMSEYAQSLVKRLDLEPHPEGGWYASDWRSRHEDTVSKRPLSSLIYFLLAQGDASAWHKVDADEIWLWHGPASVRLELGGYGDAPESDPDKIQTISLGNQLTDGGSQDASTTPVGHMLVPEGCWQRTVPGKGDALVSCVVSPGFTFDGFTLEEGKSL